MDLTCFNCKKSWDVPQAHIVGAKLKYGLGFDEHGFICPNCKTKNYLSKQEFEAEMNEPDDVPSTAKTGSGSTGTVTGARGTGGVRDAKPGATASGSRPTAARSGPTANRAARTARPGGGLVGRAGVARPAQGPSFQARPRKGVVSVRSLRVREDHSTTSEVVAGLVRGNEVEIINTWTDGENTWAQLGPNRWAAIVYNDEALIELTD